MQESKKTILFGIIGIIIGLIIGLTIPNIINDTKKCDSEQKEEIQNNKENSVTKELTFDEIFNKLDISLEENEIYEFIHSSSTLGFQSNNLMGTIFQEEISNEYKVIYAISKATWKAFDDNYEYMSDNYDSKVTLKKETVEKLAKQIFNNVTIPNVITKDSWYGGIYDITCSNDLCTYNYTTFGLEAPILSGYEGPVTKEGNKYVVKPIFIDYKNDTYENDEVITDIILKDRHDGKIIKTLKQQKLSSLEDPESERDVYYKSLSKYYTTITTYTYEFNEENVLLSVKKS